jgi:serine/threonine-protein kinase HipA
MIAGESANPNKKHLLELANYFKVKNANLIIDEVQNYVNEWNKYAKLCNISKNTIKNIQKVINKI